jgi:NADPH2:quinone reductase
MLVERPDPVVAAGQVVVRNQWIGVNYVDLQHRAGQPYPVRLPLIPGTEAAGTVVEVGSGADPGGLAPQCFTSVISAALTPR